MPSEAEVEAAAAAIWRSDPLFTTVRPTALDREAAEAALTAAEEVREIEEASEWTRSVEKKMRDADHAKQQRGMK